MKIDKITREQIRNEVLPIKDLLKNSLYYPACGLDGGVVKFYSHKINSFVLSDFSIGYEKFMDEINSFRGYEVFANRPVKEYELNPTNKNIEFSSCFKAIMYMKYPKNQDLKSSTFPSSKHYRLLPKNYNYEECLKEPFVHWVVYKREKQYGSDWGPGKFSLLFVGGDGVETYLKLYPPNRSSAKVLAIIQSGYGFGGNWTNFTDENQHLAKAINCNEFGTPSEILYGGIGNDYETNPNFNWEGYEYSGEKISPYYSPEIGSSFFNKHYGEVTIWRKKNKI